MLILGLLLFVYTFFVAGAFALSLVQTPRSRSFMEWIILGVTFGFAILPPFFFVVGRGLGGFPIGAMYVVAGTATIGCLYELRIRKVVLTGISKYELMAIAVAICHASILLLYLLVYPIFPPELFIHDYLVHLTIATNPSVVLYGWLTSGLYNLTQIGSYIFLSVGVATIGGNPLVDVRYVMIAMGLTVPLLVYYTSLKCFRNAAAALMATAAYSFIFSFWGVGLLYTGLYGQFYAGVLAILSIALSAEFIEGKLHSAGIGLIVLALVLAHPSSAIYIAVVSGLSFVLYLAKRNEKRYLILGAYHIVPVVVAIAFVGVSGLANFLLSVESPQGVAVYANNLTNQILVSFPFLLVPGSGGLLPLFVILPTLLLAVWRARCISENLPTFLIVGWFLVIWGLSIAAEGLHAISRYVTLGALPAGFLFGLMYLWLVEPLKRRLRRPNLTANGPIRFLPLILTSMMLLFAFQGATGNVLSDLYSQHQYLPPKQADVYDSMVWIQQNSPHNAVVASVGLPWYYFSSYFTGRSFLGDHLMDSSSMTNYLSNLNNGSLSKTGNSTYVVLFTLLHSTNESYLPHYTSNPHYRLLWNSSTVAVFEFGR